MYLNVMEKVTSSRDAVNTILGSKWGNEMENLKYVINSKCDANFYFCSIKGSIGFDYWEDFLIIVDVINKDFFPEEIKYSGITDIFGYFIKNGLKVDMECTSMLGVIFTIPKDRFINVEFDAAYKMLNSIWLKAIKAKNRKYDTKHL